MMTKNSKINPELISGHIVNWLKDYVEKSGCKGFVIGISGGIDSAVTSTLCALTGYKTLCVELPIHQAESQVNRKKEHIEALQSRFPNVNRLCVDLTETFDQLKTILPTATDEKALLLSLANTRSRLRMTTLYYLAGINNLLVAGTGNKIEDFGVGFFTKYGDGGVDLSPIADLMKSEVYTLGHYLKVPHSILTAVPTDGLFGDERSDEDQLGASYDELEWAMNYFENFVEDISLSHRQKEVLSIYKKLNSANEHKMKPIPICKIPNHLKK